MTKAEYLSNSAKLFTASSVLLFISTACLLLGNFSEKIGSYGQTLSDYSFYIVLFLTALALNGEGIGYKRHRDYINKKRIKYVKAVLAFAVILRFTKGIVEAAVLNVVGDGVSLIIAKIFLGFINTIGTYGFLFTSLSFLYMQRDASNKKLFLTEVVAFTVGVMYAVYRTFYYAVVKYSLTEFGESLGNIFSSSTYLYAISLIQYTFFVVMCVAVMLSYNKRVLDEHDVLVKERKNMLVAPKIYNTDLVGIDFLEDEFLLPANNEDDY